MLQSKKGHQSVRFAVIAYRKHYGVTPADFHGGTIAPGGRGVNPPLAIFFCAWSDILKI
jgi:hypothetical protein